jgi:DNA polymerase-3 subunit alpha (Gram-positive type)
MQKTVKYVFQDYTNKNSILEGTIEAINLFKKSNKLEVGIKVQNQLTLDELVDFESYLSERFQIKTIELKIKYDDIELKNTIQEDWEKIEKYIAKRFPITKAILKDSSVEVNENRAIINLKTKNSDFLHSYEIDKVINIIFMNLYGKNYKIEYKENVTEEELQKQQSFLEEIQNSVCKNLVHNMEFVANEKKVVETKSGEVEAKEDEPKEETPLIIGRSANIKEQVVKIKDLTVDYGRTALQGKVIRTDSRELKNGKTLVMFDVYDGTSTITCKSFVEPEKVASVLARIKPKMRVKLQGNVQYDNYANEIGVIANVVIELPTQEEIMRMDNAMTKRVELHMHTQMSQMDAITPAKELIKRAAKWGMKSIAITDHGVVQAFPEAKHAVDDLGLDIKVIYGVEAYFVPDDEIPQDVTDGWKKVKPYHAIILTQTQEGLKNLYKLISISHLSYYHKRPRVLESVFNQYREGLLLGSACEQGELYKAILNNKPEEKIERIANYYDYYEIQPLGNNNFMLREGIVPDEETLKNINRKIVELGEKHNKLVVATCDVHFMDPQDEVYRRILMAGQGFSDCDNQAPLYLRTTEEMLREFEYFDSDKAYELVVTNPNKIADMCEAVCPISKEKCPPVIEGAEEEIKETCENKAKELYGDPLPEIVQARLKRELDSIIKNGFSTLYIIAQRLVLKSNEDGYLVGSRGSVGSSFVANMLGITEVNSLPPHYRCPNCKYSDFTDYGIKNGVDLPDKECPKCGAKLYKDGMDIPFETFLGFNGDKEPDIDLNFSGEYQGKIHRYAEVIFGKGTTFKAGTVGTMAEKTAFGYVKKYFEERNIPITNAEILRLVDGCVGVKRTTGQHPGGIIVVPHGREIYEFCPVQHPADDPNSDIITTHFDYHSIDKNLLKLDMLGHDDPTVIRMLQDLTGIDPKTIPLDDKETMSLFTSTKALGVTPEQINSKVGSFGVPEFGTKFVREMLVDTKPTTFEELIRISGLSHGTDVWLNNAQTLIQEGTATLSEAICTRDDIMTYLIKQGLPPDKAFKIMESVRKGKGLKPDQEEIMRENNVPEWYIDSCKKIKYMFPKAHAVAYVTMAFRIAWFKVHHPLAYYAAFFSIRADEFDSEFMIYGKEKVKAKMKELELQGNSISTKDKGMYTILEIVLEMYERGFEFLPVDLYKSHNTKFLIEDGKIRPPLTSIAGLGGIAAESIYNAAKLEGKFMCIDDLQLKAKIGKSMVELLSKFGCLDGIPQSNQISLFG